MKLMAVMGSPHGMAGNTGPMLKALIDAAKDAGAEVDLFCLSEMDVRPCRGCGACHKTGECVIKDDFARIKEALLGSDGIVLASPNYIFSVSAQLKAMMDRCSCPIHCQALDGRYGAAVVTSGGGGEDEVADYAQRFLRVLGCWTVGSAGAAAWQLAEKAGRRQALQRAAALGRALVEAVEQKKTYPEQAEERAAFQERIRALVMAQGDEWPYEFAWWQKEGTTR
jgi:multimeric flavodoxin WrbA